MRVLVLPVITVVTLLASEGRASTAIEVFNAASRSTVTVIAYDGKDVSFSSGSGVVIRNGVVATNCHVIEGAARTAIRYRHEEYHAARQHRDWERDICTLDVKGLNAPSVEIGTTQELRVGARVYAIGGPQGLELTLSEGIVSSLRESDGGHYIQTTAPISPGSSGGGLFDDSGRLIGLTTFYMEGGQNLNFALPVEWVVMVQARQDEISGRLREFLQLQNQGDLQGATGQARQWTAAMPNVSLAWLCLAIAYERKGGMGMTVGARDAYKRLFSLGHDKASMVGPIEQFTQVLQDDPENFAAYFGLGVAYRIAGEWEQAVTALESALELNPNDENAWLFLGYSSYSYYDKGKAVGVFQHALRRIPDSSLLWTGMGWAFSVSGQIERSIQSYENALALDPDNAAALYSLGREYKISGETRKALEVYRRLQEVDPEKAKELFEKYLLP